MAINTGQINPNAFGYMPSFPEGADGIISFISGFQGARKAGAEEQNAVAKAEAEGKPAPKTSYFNRFRQGVINAPGVRAEGADPFAKMKSVDFQQRLATGAVELQGKILENKAKTHMATATLEDQRTMETLMDGMAANPNLLNEMQTAPVFKTPQYQAAFGQMSDFNQKSLVTKARQADLADFRARSLKLQPRDRSVIGSIEFNKDGSVTAEQWDALTEAEARSAPPQSTFGKLLADRAAAPEADRALYDQQISALGAKEGISIQFDDQGRPIINYGPNATNIGKPSVATQTQAQQKLLKYENSMELLTQLEKGLRPEHVGVAGAGGELLLDRTLAQFVPGAANTNRIQARTALIAAKEGLMREISDDPRFSNKDREEIGKALPSSGVFESYPDAITRIKTVKNILANRGKVYSSGLGLKPPAWSLSKDEIRAAFQKGEMTQEEAVSALQRFHTE